MVVLAALAGGYLAARPALAERFPTLLLAEFPAALAIVGTLLYFAARPRRRAEEREVLWLRHEQRVRDLPDPEAAPLVAALDAYVQRGERVDESADILARAASPDRDARFRERDRLRDEMARAGSRRRREAVVERALRSSHADQGV